MNKATLIVLTTLILTACSPTPETADSTQDMKTPEQTVAQGTTQEIIPEQNPESQVDESAVKTFEIEGGSFYYSPDEIRVQQGDTVRLVFNSVDMMHDLVIDELGVRIPITQSGETNEVTFIADQAGEFEFYCSVGNHRAQGQTGMLIVE